MRSRCLIIGASGQLGRALCAALRGRHEVIEAVHRNPGAGQVRMDLEETASILEGLRHLQPTWILMAAAYCNVDRAETEPDTCFRVNVEGPRTIARYAREHEARVVYYSTDHVFDGAKDSYSESDAVRPLNLYARSKAEGEAVVRALLPQHHLILRLASLYGPDAARRNFVLRLVDELTAGGRVRVPSDQWGSPTYTEDVAAVTACLMERKWNGLLHATGPELMDRVSFAKRICACFHLNPDGLVPSRTDQLVQAARRPLRVRLDCQALEALGVGRLRPVEEGLAALARAQGIAPMEVVG